MAKLNVELTLTDKFSSPIDAIQGKVDSLKRGLTNLGDGTSNIEKATSTAKSSISSLNSTVKKTPGLFSNLASGIKSAVKVIGGLSVVKGVMSEVSDSVSSAIQRIDTQQSFVRKMKLITGDANVAETMKNQLNEQVTGTPYGLDKAMTAAQNLVTRGMAPDEAVKSTQIWMDAVSAYGMGTNEEFASVADAIAKMRTKGTVEMKQLNRLFEIGLNPVQIYAQAVGKTSEEVQAALSEKDIRADEFLSVVETAMREGTNGVTVISGQAREAATTWAATIANSKAALTRGTAELITALDDAFKNEDGTGGLKDMLISGAKAMETGLKSLAQFIREDFPPIAEMIKNVYNSIIEHGPAIAKTFALIGTALEIHEGMKFASEAVDFLTAAYQRFDAVLDNVIKKVSRVAPETEALGETMAPKSIRKKSMISEPVEAKKIYQDQASQVTEAKKQTVKKTTESKKKISKTAEVKSKATKADTTKKETSSFDQQLKDNMSRIDSKTREIATKKNAPQFARRDQLNKLQEIEYQQRQGAIASNARKDALKQQRVAEAIPLGGTSFLPDNIDESYWTSAQPGRHGLDYFGNLPEVIELGAPAEMIEAREKYMANTKDLRERISQPSLEYEAPKLLSAPKAYQPNYPLPVDTGRSYLPEPIETQRLMLPEPPTYTHIPEGLDRWERAKYEMSALGNPIKEPKVIEPETGMREINEKSLKSYGKEYQALKEQQRIRDVQLSGGYNGMNFEALAEWAELYRQPEVEKPKSEPLVTVDSYYKTKQAVRENTKKPMSAEDYYRKKDAVLRGNEIMRDYANKKGAAQYYKKKDQITSDISNQKRVDEYYKKKEALTAKAKDINKQKRVDQYYQTKNYLNDYYTKKNDYKRTHKYASMGRIAKETKASAKKPWDAVYDPNYKRKWYQSDPSKPSMYKRIFGDRIDKRPAKEKMAESFSQATIKRKELPPVVTDAGEVIPQKQSFAGAMFSNVGNFAKTAAQSMIAPFKLAYDAITNIFAPFGNWIKGIFSGIYGVLNECILAPFGAVFSALKNVAVTSFGFIAEKFTSLSGAFLNSGFGQVIQMFVGWLGNFSTAFIGALPGITLVVGALGALAIGLGKLNEQGQGSVAVNTFFMNLYQQVPAQLGAISQKIQEFVGNFITNAPQLAQQGADLVNVIILGIVNTVPSLIAQGANLVIQFITAIVQCIPTLLDTGFMFINGLLDGIRTGWPQLLQNGIDMVLGICNSIIENFPSIVQAGKEIIQSVVNGISSTIPNLIRTGWQMILDFIAKIKENLPQILDTGARLITTLVSGILSFASFLFTAGLELMGNLLSALFANLPNLISAGWELVKTLAGAIWDNRETIWNFIVQIVTGIGTAIKDAVVQIYDKAKEIGSNILQGLKDGFGEMWENTKSWFNEKFGGIIDVAKGAFDTNSPSKKFSEIGKYNAMGIKEGFSGVMPQVNAEINKEIQDLVNQTVAKIDEMRTTIEDQYAQLGTELQSNVNNMTNTLNTQWTDLAEFSVSVTDQMSKAVDMALQTVVDITKISWGTVVTTTNQLLEDMTETVTTSYTTLSKNITDTMSALVPFHQSIGKDMMKALADGIVFSEAQVLTATSNLVAKLKSIFETGLGIQSPSRYMKYIGEMMLEGLIRGLSQQQIKAFVKSVVEDMKASFLNGKFNADQLVEYMGDNGTMSVVKYLELIGDQTTSDLFGDGGVPAIIQEALKYVGYAPGHGNSIMGLRYGNSGAWCASFIRYCAENVGVPFPASDYVPTILQWSKDTGRYTQIPQPGYAAIFGNGSHIELVAGVNGGTVDMVGGNTGMGEVKHRPRSDATSYVKLDGGHSTNTLKDTILQAYNKKYNPTAFLASGTINYNPSVGVEQWRSTVQQALQLLGQPLSLTDDVLYAIESESSGNPNSINLWDSNAKAGHPSQGLLQTIPETFATYRHPGLANNITDPLANIYAGLNYMIKRYGSIENVVSKRRNGWFGYAKGTQNATRGLHWVGEEGPELMSFRGGEKVYPHDESVRMANSIAYTPRNADAEPIAMSSGMDSTATRGVVDNRTINVGNNNTFNISSDADAQKFIGDFEAQLHQVLSSGMRIMTGI